VNTADTARIQALYDQTLRPRLEDLEGLRRTVRGFIVRAAVIISIPALAAFGGEFIADVVAPGHETTISIGSFVLMIVAIVFATIRYFLPAFTAHANYKARFKREVVAEVFKIVCPTANYEPFKSIAADVFDESGLFNSRGSFWSDDRVRGKIGDTLFEAAEVRRAYRTGSGRSSTTHVVFEGLFVHIDCHRMLRGSTLVEPEEARSSQLGDRSGFQRVSLNHAEFERAFKVYTTDEAEARNLLTPTMLEHLITLRQRAQHPVFLGFKNSRAYIGVHYGRKLFEPGIASTTSVEALTQMAEHFALADLIVHELGLDAHVSSKSADNSILEQEDAPQHFLHTPAITSGHLTEGGLLQVAKSLGASIGDDDDGAPAPRPPDSRIQVEHEGGRATISYGLPLSFFVLVIMSIVCVMVATSALHALGWSAGVDPVAALAGRFPQLTSVDTAIRAFPLGVGIAAAVLGAFLALWWATRVRRVVIAREAIHIYRGLRPFPRQYPRPVYGRIVRIDKAVYVGKQDATSLINPTASPMLRSQEEAKWVASELRRALHQTAAG
jgi:hypothetical protein